jgi:hypothetical protein
MIGLRFTAFLLGVHTDIPSVDLSQTLHFCGGTAYSR